MFGEYGASVRDSPERSQAAPKNGFRAICDRFRVDLLQTFFDTIQMFSLEVLENR